MGIVIPCNSIFRTLLPAPGTNLSVNYNVTVNAQLSPSISIWYIVTDKFGNEYTKQVTTDENGSFELLSTDFPTGLFNPYAGSFLLQVKRTLQDATPQSLKFCNTIYDTIQMDFANFPGNVPNPIIDCK